MEYDEDLPDAEEDAPEGVKLRLRHPQDQKGELKVLGGSNADEWNNRLNNLVVGALPIAALKSKSPKRPWPSLTARWI
jgi:hypothetical protein